MTDRRQEKALMIALDQFALDYRAEIAPETSRRYMDALSDLTVEQIERAKEIIEKTETFYPSIATIRKAALLDPDRITAEQGWDLLCERIRRVGFNGGSGDLDPEIRAAMNACGGWGDLCRSERPDSDRFHFVKAFNAARERSDRKHLLNGDRAPQEMPAQLMEGMKQIGRGDDQPV